MKGTLLTLETKDLLHMELAYDLAKETGRWLVVYDTVMVSDYYRLSLWIDYDLEMKVDD